MLKAISLFGLVVMAAGLLGLFLTGGLFSPQPVAIALQISAVALFAWARLTFGWRSFHAAADPTAGGLVTTGPYRYIRHPIYTAACLFGWSGVAFHLSIASAALGGLLVVGGLIRMVCEEHLIKQSYPEYVEYSKATKRMIPYVF